jgi:hypothetical protein
VGEEAQLLEIEPEAIGGWSLAFSSLISIASLPSESLSDSSSALRPVRRLSTSYSSASFTNRIHDPFSTLLSARLELALVRVAAKGKEERKVGTAT